MKRNRVFRLLASLTVVVLCMTAFSVTAFAGGGDGDYYTGEPAETTPEPTEEPATGGMEPEGQPLTPEGNATLVDDYYGDKQLAFPPSVRPPAAPSGRLHPPGSRSERPFPCPRWPGRSGYKNNFPLS